MVTNKKTILTGITTTGSPHLGNYVGAIKPAIEASLRDDRNSCFFLADYHALIKCPDPEKIRQSTLEIAATWLALGLDHEAVTFYRQSDIPEIPELTWILSCVAAKGLMNRAHAYKASVQANVEASEDADHGVSMGLFNYPVLMTADILMFNAHLVPVGKDQLQHLEMARDIAGRFNHRYRKLFVLPQAQVDETAALLPGLDGRKMSKSYGNTIALWLGKKQLRKQIMRIVTNSKEPGEPKGTEESSLYPIYAAFVGPAEREQMKSDLAAGMAWGEAKKAVFERINSELEPAREHYEKLISNPGRMEEILRAGAQKARQYTRPLIAEVRNAVGISGLR